MQRATRLSGFQFLIYKTISIHALYAEGDLHIPSEISFSRHFNPRPLCRGRQNSMSGSEMKVKISIHALYAEGDTISRALGHSSLISIHALYAEGDQYGSDRDIQTTAYFNPRPLCRGRLQCQRDPILFFNFNPRPLCRGRLGRFGARYLRCQFQSTPSMQRATNVNHCLPPR